MKRLIPPAIIPILLTLSACGMFVDDTPPDVAILKPTASTVEAEETQLQVLASDPQSGIKSIRVSMNGADVISPYTYEPDESGGYPLEPRGLEIPWDASSASGEVVIEVTAVNGVGTTNTAERTVTVVQPTEPGVTDEEVPQIEWIRPGDGDIISGTVALSAFASDDIGITKVEFYAGSTLLAEDPEAPYSFEWDTTDPEAGRDDGPVTLTARAYDSSGRIGEAGISLTILNSGVPPVLSLIQPTDGRTVGLRFTVSAEVTEQDAEFTWVSEEGHKLWVRIYDQVGNLVTENYLTTDGTDTGAEPQPGQDFIGSRNFDLESFSSEFPLDKFDIVVEGVVNVNGNDILLRQKATVDVELASNLPPALLLMAPAVVPGVEPVFGDAVSIAGRVTDDSGSIKSVEVRMVCDACGPAGEAQNKLLYYRTDDYDLFSTGIVPLDGKPYVGESEDWQLRVVAIDAENDDLRNVITFDVSVDRDPALFAGMESGTWNVVTNPVPNGQISPSEAQWTLSGLALANETKYVAVVTKDGDVEEVVKGTFPAGATTFVYPAGSPRTFGDSDVGSWQVVLVLQDTVTGAQVTQQSPPVGVQKTE